MEKCKICGTKKFMEGTCTKKVTCEDLKLIYNNGKHLDYPKEKDTSGSPFKFSDKRIRFYTGEVIEGWHEWYWVYYEKDVKEFIKNLKEEFVGYGEYESDITWFIDKLAGKDLI